MRYVITVEGFRDASIARDTAFEAVAKAREMITAGIQGVRITDTKPTELTSLMNFHCCGIDNFVRRSGVSDFEQTPAVP
jgi:hypothetical protein